MKLLSEPSRARVVLVLGVAATLLSAACGTGAETSATASATLAESASPAGSASPAASGVDYALLLEESHTQFPTEFSGPTEPVSAQQGLKVAAISCWSIMSGCVSPVTGVEEAAQLLGWEARAFDGGGTPDTQNAQMLNAISWGADVILNVAIDPNGVQAGLRAAEDANVLVGSGSNGIASPNPPVPVAEGGIEYKFDVAPDYYALGIKTAHWIIADSQGEAHVLVYTDGTYPSVSAGLPGLLDGLEECAGCTVEPVEHFTGDQIATVLPQSVVSELRSNPAIDYVFLPYDPAASPVVHAIEQAGMADRVTLVSVLGSQENLGFIRDGKVQLADAAYDNRYMGYAMLDQALRVLANQPLIEPQGENLPFVVIDKSNVPDPGSDWYASFDYPAMFAELWKGN